MYKLLGLLYCWGCGLYTRYIRWQMARNSKRYFREKAKRARLFNAEYREWVKNTLAAQEPEPFCPFAGGYCDSAYSDSCYTCEDAKSEWEWRALHEKGGKRQC